MKEIKFKPCVLCNRTDYNIWKVVDQKVKCLKCLEEDWRISRKKQLLTWGIS